MKTLIKCRIYEKYYKNISVTNVSLPAARIAFAVVSTKIIAILLIRSVVRMTQSRCNEGNTKHFVRFMCDIRKQETCAHTNMK